jgi:hypothetical protein
LRENWNDGQVGNWALVGRPWKKNGDDSDHLSLEIGV